MEGLIELVAAFCDGLRGFPVERMAGLEKEGRSNGAKNRFCGVSSDWVFLPISFS